MIRDVYSSSSTWRANKTSSCELFDRDHKEHTMTPCEAPTVHFPFRSFDRSRWARAPFLLGSFPNAVFSSFLLGCIGSSAFLSTVETDGVVGGSTPEDSVSEYFLLASPCDVESRPSPDDDEAFFNGRLLLVAGSVPVHSIISSLV